MFSKLNEIDTQLRIIHACEKGATGVYYGHRAVAKIFFPNIVSELDDMHAHECEHFEIFGSLLSIRGSRRVSLPFLWCFGGIVYGITVAILGTNAIWVSTATIEEIVNKELDLAADFFKTNDSEIYAAVKKIKLYEEHHKNIAENKAMFTGFLPKLVRLSSRRISYIAKYLAARI